MVIIIVTHYVLGKFPMNHNAILQELLLTNSPEERKSQLHCLGWREDDDLKRGANQTCPIMKQKLGVVLAAIKDPKKIQDTFELLHVYQYIIYIRPFQ